MTAPEEERILSSVQRLAGSASDPVANLVARDGAQRDQQQQPTEAKLSSCGENSRGNQKGITRQEKSDEKPCFSENDCANEERAAPANQALHIVERVEKVS